MPESPSALPPGRRGPPLIGESLPFARNPHEFYIERVRRYGPVFKTNVLGHDTVVFSGAAPLAFMTEHEGTARQGASPSWVHEILGRCLPFADGADHQARKRIVMTAFERTALAGYLSLIEPIVASFVERWRTAGEIAWLPEHRKLSVELTAALLTTENGPEHLQALDQACARMDAGFLSLPVRLPFTRYGKALAGRDRVLAFVDAAIERRRQDPTDDLISRLILARDADGNALKGEDLRAEAVHLVYAGQTGLMFAMMLLGLGLGQHPELRTRVRDELSAHEEPLRFELIDGLPLLTATTLEIRRHYRANPATVFATTTMPMDCGGFHVPAGWRVVGALHTTSNDPASFPDPDRLDPSRFADGCPAGYAAHGAGPHRCGGEAVVTLLMQAAAVLLLRQLDWTLVNPNAGMGRQLFPLPKDDLQVRFTPVEKP